MKQHITPRRIMIELTSEQLTRLQQARQEVEQELPELLEQERKLDLAQVEPSLSGQLRRAIQSSGIPLPVLAARTDSDMTELGDFLRGDSPLPSNIIDRLAQELGFELTPADL